MSAAADYWRAEHRPADVRTAIRRSAESSVAALTTNQKEPASMAIDPNLRATIAADLLASMMQLYRPSINEPTAQLRPYVESFAAKAVFAADVLMHELSKEPNYVA